MADITKNLISILTVSDITSYRNKNKLISDNVSSSEDVSMDNFPASGINISDTMVLNTSETNSENFYNPVEASGTIALLTDPSGWRNREDIIIQASGTMPLVSDASGVITDKGSSVRSGLTSITISENIINKTEKDGAMDIVFGMVDNVSHVLSTQVSIKEIAGNYFGRIPIDINPSGTISLSAQYLDHGVWKDCILEDGDNLTTGEHRVWWNADEQLTENLTTKLKISVNNMQTYETSNVVSVTLNPQDSLIPYFVIDGWNLPASGNPPSGQFVPINPAGYTVNEIQVDMGQYLTVEDNLFMTTIGPSGVYPTSFIYDTYTDWRKIIPDTSETTYTVIRTFKNNGTLVIPDNTTVEYLIVGGGGGGGNAPSTAGGGGGAGGLRHGTLNIQADSYTITIGDGGASAFNGDDSSAFGLIANGGGRGGTSNGDDGEDGGSGGGGAAYNGGGAGGLGTNGQGNDGGHGDGSINGAAGGGGADEVGKNGTSSSGGAGGKGKEYNISGVNKFYAGGGGGGSENGTGGLGGNGGGGKGGSDNQAGENATPNSGGGGGGASYPYSGGTGGKGIIIIKYTTTDDSGFSGGDEVNTSSNISHSIENEPGSIIANNVFEMSDIIDAKRTVQWGQFELESSGVAPDMTFRASDTNPLPSGQAWVSPSGNYIFPSPSGGRYLEWKASFTSDNQQLDSLVIYPWRNKFIYKEITNEVADAGKDVVWSYLTSQHSGDVIFQYRYATESEGESALPSKSWTDLTEKHNIADITARYMEWQAILNGGQLDKVIVAYGDDDKQQLETGLIADKNLGILDIRLIGYDDVHSKSKTSSCIRGSLMLDDNIPYISVWSSFVWDNAIDIDEPRQDMTYLFQLVSEDDYDNIDTVDINEFDTTTQFEAFYSKDASVTVANDKVSLNTSVDNIGDIVYRIGDGTNRVWTDIVIEDNHSQNILAYDIKYYIRTSDNQTVWTEWQEVQNVDSFLIRSGYIEIKASFIYYSGSDIGEIFKISLFSIDGKNAYVINESSGNTTTYSVTDTPLEVDKYYFYRVKAFDGSKFSYWSVTSAVYTYELGTPYAPTDLKTENETTPVHVIVFNPYFSWTFNDNPVGSGYQKNARVQVGTASGVWNIWDSGKIQTPSGIIYAQPSGLGATNPISLNRGVDYFWRVRTWDDSAQNLAGPFSEATTFRINRLPTVPKPLGVTD